MNSLIIGDTNFYRTLVHTKSLKDYRSTLCFFSELKLAEAAMGCQSGADIFVILELLSHLADTSDPSYKNCFLSAIGLSEHVKRQDGSMAIIATPEQQIPKEYFGYDDPSDYETARAMEEKLVILNDEKHHDKIPLLEDSFIEIKKHVDMIESQFIDDMMTYVVKYINQNATDWRPLAKDKAAIKEWREMVCKEEFYIYMAEGMLSKYINKAGYNAILSNDKYEATIIKYSNDYKIPINMYIKIIKRIIETGCDISKPKNSNWVWDIQVAHALLKNHKMKGKTPILVTNDRFIHQIAVEEQLGDRIFTVDQCLKCLGV